MAALCGSLGYASATAQGWSAGGQNPNLKTGFIHGGRSRFKKTRGIDAQTHARNFFDCVRSRKATITNPDVMLHSHLACFAASLSWILGRKLAFDPAKDEFIGDAEANSLRSRPERDCWA